MSKSKIILKLISIIVLFIGAYIYGGFLLIIKTIGLILLLFIIFYLLNNILDIINYITNIRK